MQCVHVVVGAARWRQRQATARGAVFTLLTALVDFATEGFGALINLSIGLFALAILSYQLDVATRALLPAAPMAAQTAAT